MLMDFSIEIFETKSENRLCICIAIETRFDFKSLIDLKWANENDEKKNSRDIFCSIFGENCGCARYRSV